MPALPATPAPKLLDIARQSLRRKHYSLRTEASYLPWIRRFILFHHKRHARTMGAPEIEAFLTHLAVDQKVSAPTQNEALGALLFLYRNVLGQDCDLPLNALRARCSHHLPTVLTREQVQQLISCLSGTHQLMAKLLYGSGWSSTLRPTPKTTLMHAAIVPNLRGWSLWRRTFVLFSPCDSPAQPPRLIHTRRPPAPSALPPPPQG